MVDGQSATGTDNRDKLLKAYANGRAKAIPAEDFLAEASRVAVVTPHRSHRPNKSSSVDKDHQLFEWRQCTCEINS
jgi:hypothetical protein